jgi:PAS domain S-box-containing protein
MSEHDLLQDAEQARHQLTALRARLEHEGAGQGSPEVRSTLGDLLEMLEKLQAHCGFLREVLTRINDAVFGKDPEGRYVMINRQGAGMFGKSVEEILGRDDTTLFERESAERIMAIDRVVMSTGMPHTFEQTLDIRGVPATLLTTETAWHAPHGTLRGIIGTAQDVTERRRTEREAEIRHGRLRSLVSETVIAEERLRQSLAADLHSALAQDIALAKMKLSALRSTASADLHDSLVTIERIFEQADHSLRSITFQLSPPSLHDLGLVPALQWLAEDIGGRYGLDMRIEDERSPTVTDERMRLILYRAVRELLMNVAMHTGACEIRVRIGSDDGLLRITVEDEGAGFDPARVDLDGRGLFGIREHLAHVGGSMHIDSSPGRGTTVVLTAPLAPVSPATT